MLRTQNPNLSIGSYQMRPAKFLFAFYNPSELWCKGRLFLGMQASG